MSVFMSGEPRVQDVIDAARGAVKCRIPQRLAPARVGRPPATSTPKTKPSHFDSNSRPRSANRVREESLSVRQAYGAGRPNKPNERGPVAPKRPPLYNPKKSTQMNENYVSSNKTPRQVVIVPMTQKVAVKGHVTNASFLPDQATIAKHENMELNRSPLSEVAGIQERESITSRSDKLMQLKINWQEYVIQFEKMKSDLKGRQNGVLELYAAMRDIHRKMSSLGEKTNLPTIDDLRIMNVAKLAPEQLLQLCAGDDASNPHEKQYCDGNPLIIDVKKLYEMPRKMADTCEQTLLKRKEIIDWFEALKTKENGISVHALSKKINEFRAENDMLKYSLDKVKSEFRDELDDIVNLMRKSVKETMALHLHSEELTYELSELNSQNADLKKQMHNADHIRSHSNKSRIEEIEKELKEEKCKRSLLTNRLARTDGQLKMSVERCSQLEASLEQARNQTRALERTVQQLHEQNQKLQDDFNNELNKLRESIKEHTLHLEEIADAREKLQLEKEDLEKKLTELSMNYNESLKNIKHEMNLNVVKLIETEKRYDKEVEEKKRLEEKLETQHSQLVEAELRHKEALKLIEEKDSKLDKAQEAQKELEITKRDLEKTIVDINNNRDQMVKEREACDRIERNYKEAVKSLQCELRSREEYIYALEKKKSILEQQLQENESKMESYVEQLSSLKTNINQLQEHFGAFENLTELHEKVNQQRAKLLEATRENGILAEEVQNKDRELERYNVTLLQNEELLIEREDVIKMMSKKEEEHTNSIKILRNHLEQIKLADNEMSQEIADKNTQIDSLIVNIETMKQQISNLEKIILTLEDQTRKASVQRKKDQEHIVMLEKKLVDFEAYHVEARNNNETSAENLDNLIKLLENELDTGIADEIGSKHHGHVTNNKYAEQVRPKSEYPNNDLSSTFHSKAEGFPTKIVIKSLNKKPCNRRHDEYQNFGDNLERKKTRTNVDTKCAPAPNPNLSVCTPRPPSLLKFKENVSNVRKQTRNLHFVDTNLLRDEKQHKLFKWAGHRL